MTQQNLLDGVELIATIDWGGGAAGQRLRVEIDGPSVWLRVLGGDGKPRGAGLCLTAAETGTVVVSLQLARQRLLARREGHR